MSRDKPYFRVRPPIEKSLGRPLRALSIALYIPQLQSAKQVHRLIMRPLLLRLVLLGSLVVPSKQTGWQELVHLTEEQAHNFLHQGDPNPTPAQIGASRAVIDEPSQHLEGFHYGHGTPGVEQGLHRFERLLNDDPLQQHFEGRLHQQTPQQRFGSLTYDQQPQHLQKHLYEPSPQHLASPISPYTPPHHGTFPYGQRGLTAEIPPHHLKNLLERLPDVPIVNPPRTFDPSTSSDALPAHIAITVDPLSEIFGDAAGSQRAAVPSDASSSGAGSADAHPYASVPYRLSQTADPYIAPAPAPAPVPAPAPLRPEERREYLDQAARVIRFYTGSEVKVYPFEGKGISSELIKETYANSKRNMYWLGNGNIAVRHSGARPPEHARTQGGMYGDLSVNSRLYVWKVSSISHEGGIVQILGLVNTDRPTTTVVGFFPSLGRTAQRQVVSLGLDSLYDYSLREDSRGLRNFI